MSEQDDREGREEERPQRDHARFSQDQVNRMIEERVVKERDRFKDYDELKAKLAQVTERAAQLERVTGERDDAVKALNDTRAANTALLDEAALLSEAVTLGARHPRDVVRLVDRERLERDDNGRAKNAAAIVKALAEERPTYFGAGTPAPPPDGGARERTGPARQPDMDQMMRAAITRQ